MDRGPEHSEETMDVVLFASADGSQAGCWEGPDHGRSPGTVGPTAPIPVTGGLEGTKRPSAKGTSSSQVSKLYRRVRVIDMLGIW